MYTTHGRLVSGAEEAAAHFQEFFEADHREKTEEEIDREIDRLGITLDTYWALKVQMAAGSEPEHIRVLLTELRPLCSGVGLCGAGAGGYAVAILKTSVTVEDMRAKVDILLAERNKSNTTALEELSVHTVSVDADGILVSELEVEEVRGSASSTSGGGAVRGSDYEQNTPSALCDAIINSE